MPAAGELQMVGSSNGSNQLTDKNAERGPMPRMFTSFPLLRASEVAEPLCNPNTSNGGMELSATNWPVSAVVCAPLPGWTCLVL